MSTISVPVFIGLHALFDELLPRVEFLFSLWVCWKGAVRAGLGEKYKVLRNQSKKETTHVAVHHVDVVFATATLPSSERGQ